MWVVNIPGIAEQFEVIFHLGESRAKSHSAGAPDNVSTLFYLTLGKMMRM